LRQEFGIAPEAFVVGAIARLVPSKGIEVLIRAVSMLASRYSALRLMIVGSGPEESRLRALTAKCQLTDRTFFLGSQVDLTAPLSVMDAFVFPIVGPEGFGLVLLEAMAMELPVIATQQPALTHVLDEGRAGLLVPSGDSVALSRAIARLMDEPAFAEQLGLRGFARVREQFASQRMLDQLEAVYAQVVKAYHATTPSRRA